MSEEAVENDTVLKTEPSICKEPSFHGRLQLKDFMFNGPTHASSGPRRSPRLWGSQTPTSVSSEPITLPASQTPSEVLSPVPKRAVRKRKSQHFAPASPPAPPRRRRKTAKDESENENENGDNPLSPRKKKNRTRASSSYAPPSTYAHLPPLTDVIAPNLLILFIGLNPGVQTARSGHAYAHPSNLFWKLLYSSGITPVPCSAEEDGTLPARFSLGNTNIVARPSRNGAELSKAEMDAGVAILEEKCRRWRPEVVCLVGKSIWESIFRVWKGRNLAKGEFEYGWQTERMGAVPPGRDSAAVKIGAGVVKDLVKAQTLIKKEEEEEESVCDPGGWGGRGDGTESEIDVKEEEKWEKVDDGPWEGSRIFVATSTSGLAASLSRAEKERIWKILGDWCVQRRKERAEGETKKMEA